MKHILFLLLSSNILFANVYIKADYKCDVNKYLNSTFDSELFNLIIYMPDFNAYRVTGLYFPDVDYFIDGFEVVNSHTISKKIWTEMKYNKRIFIYPQVMEIRGLDNRGNTVNVKYDRKSFTQMNLEKKECNKILEQKKDAPVNRVKNFFGFEMK